MPVEERETVDAGLRQIDFLDTEIAQVERLIARDALTLAADQAADDRPRRQRDRGRQLYGRVGDIHRFADPRKLVGYLGLDPRVRQSGSGPASHGQISKQGSGGARHALVESCWSAVRQPGPLHAFYQRVRARRGHSVAIVACARKLACLFWVLLTRDEDYAYAQPSLTRKKLRRLELAAGAQRYAQGRPESGQPTRPSAKPNASSPARPRSPTGAPSPTATPTQADQGGRGRDTGTRISRPSKRQAARQTTVPDPALQLVVAHAHPHSAKGAPRKSKRP